MHAAWRVEGPRYMSLWAGAWCFTHPPTVTEPGHAAQACPGWHVAWVHMHTHGCWWTCMCPQCCVDMGMSVQAAQALSATLRVCVCACVTMLAASRNRSAQLRPPDSVCLDRAQGCGAQVPRHTALPRFPPCTAPSLWSCHTPSSPAPCLSVASPSAGLASG